VIAEHVLLAGLVHTTVYTVRAQRKRLAATGASEGGQIN
jgi:hypothetical protein